MLNGNDEFSEYFNDDADNNGNDNGNDNGNNDEFFDIFEDYSHPAFDLPEISKLPKEDRFT